MHILRMTRIVQQGHPFSFLFKFDLNNHIPVRVILPTNQIASANSSSLIGRYLKERLDVDWSTVMKVVALFSDVHV